MGVCHNAAIAHLIKYDPYIERIRYKSVSLAEFAQYDGYFDTSALPNLPRFNDMAYVDWYLWWYGLDPKIIHQDQKRNQVWISRLAWNDVYNQLKSIQGPKLIFTPKASTPLRTIPVKSCQRLVKEWLLQKPNLTVFTTANIGFEDARCINLDGKTGDTEHFTALIAQSDFCVSADSFAPHVSDAASVPCVTISSAMPSSFFPYYPYGQTIEIAGMDKLSGFKKSFGEKDEWEKMEANYLDAFEKIEGQEVFDTLDRLNAKEKDGQPNLHVISGYRHPLIYRMIRVL
ncbi:MAG: hypothetical protein IJT59_06860 [Desulfovibrionaceae bacterium]|nr:hypothetical protein [Desulfovibrionaceae bacterium]